MHPAGTAVFQNAAAQTPFADNVDIRRLILEIDEKEAPAGILLVLKQGDTGRWIKEKGQNFFIPVAVPSGQEAFSEVSTLLLLPIKSSKMKWAAIHGH